MPAGELPKIAMMSEYIAYVPGSFMLYASRYGSPPWRIRLPTYAYSPSSRSNGTGSSRRRITPMTSSTAATPTV
jgi:hypothetical protein